MCLSRDVRLKGWPATVFLQKSDLSQLQMSRLDKGKTNGVPKVNFLFRERPKGLLVERTREAIFLE